MDDIQPIDADGIPLCSTDCPQYVSDDCQTTRCRLWAKVFEGPICEPAVDRMAKSRAELLAACEAAEDLIGFHEGSEETPRPGMYPQILLNAEDHATLLASLRAAIANATPTTNDAPEGKP